MVLRTSTIARVHATAIMTSSPSGTLLELRVEGTEVSVYIDNVWMYTFPERAHGPLYGKIYMTGSNAGTHVDSEPVEGEKKHRTMHASEHPIGRRWDASGSLHLTLPFSPQAPVAMPFHANARSMVMMMMMMPPL